MTAKVAYSFRNPDKLSMLDLVEKSPGVCNKCGTENNVKRYGYFLVTETEKEDNVSERYVDYCPNCLGVGSVEKSAQFKKYMLWAWPLFLISLLFIGPLNSIGNQNENAVSVSGLGNLIALVILGFAANYTWKFFQNRKVDHEWGFLLRQEPVEHGNALYYPFNEQLRLEAQQIRQNSQKSKVEARKPVINASSTTSKKPPVTDPRNSLNLAARLEALDYNGRSVAIQALINTGVPAVNSLINLLEHNDADIRKRAAFALAQIGDKSAVMPLTRLLKDNDSGVRGYAAAALKMLGDPRALPALKAARQDKDKFVRTDVEEAIDRIQKKSERAIKDLIEQLSDDDSQVQDNAFSTLRKRLEVDSIPYLLQVFRTQDSQSDGFRLAHRLLTAVCIHDVNCVDYLLAAINDNHPEVRHKVAGIFWTIANPRHEDPTWKISDVEIVERLLTLLQDPDGDVRQMAMIAFTAIGDERALPLLREIAENDPLDYVRNDAVRALKTLTGEDFVAKTQEAEDNDADADDRFVIPPTTAQDQESLQNNGFQSKVLNDDVRDKLRAMLSSLPEVPENQILANFKSCEQAWGYMSYYEGTVPDVISKLLVNLETIITRPGFMYCEFELLSGKQFSNFSETGQFIVIMTFVGVPTYAYPHHIWRKSRDEYVLWPQDIMGG